MRIRFMNPHAESKSLPRAKPRGPLHSHPYRRHLKEFSRKPRSFAFRQTKNAARWPHNSRNLLHSPTPLKARKVYESSFYFSRHARVERTRLSAAVDVDLDFDWEGHLSTDQRRH